MSCPKCRKTLYQIAVIERPHCTEVRMSDGSVSYVKPDGMMLDAGFRLPRSNSLCGECLAESQANRAEEGV